MISLTRLNGAPVTLNAELIEALEAAPNQTVVHLATSNRYVVRESVDAIVEKVIEYRRKVNSGAKAVNPIQGFERT
ncbi:MAG: flagellar FlbD family protein [Elusimicrobia bacterium]|nr:flagellar FlbD family protein [Elusimicrobiota bacterium]